jgi:arginyl-tRNA synthetase
MTQEKNIHMRQEKITYMTGKEHKHNRKRVQTLHRKEHTHDTGKNIHMTQEKNIHMTEKKSTYVTQEKTTYMTQEKSTNITQEKSTNNTQEKSTHITQERTYT